MFAENLWWQALFTVQTKFPFEFFIAKTFSATWPFGAAYGFLSVFGFIFPRRKIRKKTKQHLIIHHSEIKKVIYVLFLPSTWLQNVAFVVSKRRNTADQKSSGV